MKKQASNEYDFADYSELINQAELFLTEINPIMGNANQINFRRQIATGLAALMINNAHSLYVLMLEGNIFSSAIILRTMIEQYANLKYIYLTPTYENLVRFLYDGDQYFIKNAKKAAGELRKFNSKDLLDPFIEDAEGSIRYRVSSSSSLRRYGYPLKSMPTFADRIQEIIQEDDDFELLLLYIYEYVTFSRNVHTTKDKLIEMSYAENYEDWFNAVGGDRDKEEKQIVNAAGDVVVNTMKFLAIKFRVKQDHEFFTLAKDRKYFKKYNMPES